MDSLDGILAMECLTLATDDLVPYVLSWTLDPESREPAEASVLVIMRRTGGVLLVVPASFLPMVIVEQGNAGSPTSVFGPSVEFEVPAMLADGGIVSQTGGTVLVRVIDCTEGIMSHLREFMEDEEVTFSFDEDSPFAFPSIDALVPLVRAWATATSEQLAAFYSPKEMEDPADADATPPPRRPPARKATPSGSGPKAKRVTTAALSTQLEEVLGLLPQMSQQLTLLSTRQQKLEDQLPTLGKSAAVAVAQPLGAALDLPQLPVSSLAKTLQPPPRTAARQNLGLLASPGLGKPVELEALEEEKAGLEPRSAQISGDALAQAVLVQSQALTSLVAQIAHVQGDPMSELTSSGGAGVRGASGRAKLQAELALQKGLFFRAVLQSMSRRMSPTSSSDASPQELLNRGVSGVRYLEIRRIWQTEGAGPVTVPGHDGPGLHDGGTNGCRHGRSGSAGRDNRTGMFGRWQDGSGHSPLFARGCTSLDLYQQADDEHLPHQGLRSFGRPTMGHLPRKKCIFPDPLQMPHACHHFWKC